MSYNACPGPCCEGNIPAPHCHKFEYYHTEYCARCGWERHDHDRAPLIHNGRRSTIGRKP